MVFNTELLSPIDECGCGDTGYLTSRTLPIDLLHGPGKIFNAPVYSCSSDLCDKYTIPPLVLKRIEELAELMEEKNISLIEFTWEQSQESDSEDVSSPKDHRSSLVQAFTLKFHKRKYQDAEVILIIPGQEIILQSTLDPNEYYTLKYLPEVEDSIQFSFFKFYYDETKLDYETYMQLEPVYIKELGGMEIEEIEEAMEEVFGEIVSR